MKNLAIIPARSGSKGLRNKNIKYLNGMPMISYSIKAALESDLFDEVMVSTDSCEYADISKSYGAKVPFLRSKENSGERSGTWDVVREVLECYNNIGDVFDTICLLQPTSPLRTADDIVNAYKLFIDRKAIAVISVCETDHPKTWCRKINNDLSLDGFIDRVNGKRRQEEGCFYRINGAIYIVNVEELLKDDFLYRNGCFAYKMNKRKSIDIDDEIDFLLAETLLKAGVTL